MNQLLKKLTEQELLDKLAELSSRLSSGRGSDPAYEYCKMDIEEIQEEIESRRKLQRHSF
jgi:hypothetical protein